MAQTKSTKKTSKAQGFTAEERAAMRERVKELKAAGRRADGEKDVLAKIAEMSQPDRSVAERIHAIVRESAPDLAPRTWYGMPAYEKDGKVLCFFRDSQKFKERYMTFGFNESAKLDDGAMWPIAFALTELTPAGEEKIRKLVKKAAS